MAIIYSYQKAQDILGTDNLLGTSTEYKNGKPKSQTKTFSVQALKNFINANNVINPQDLQSVVGEGNTILLPSSTNKGIGITVPDLQNQNSNGVVITVNTQTGIYSAPDAYVAVINGQNPGSLSGFVGGFSTIATGASNYSFVSEHLTGATSSVHYTAINSTGITSDFINFSTGAAQVFKIDYLGNATANSFAKPGGTSSQFLKADGSVDATGYVSKYIKSNESLSLAQRKGDVLYGILDQYTGEEITLSKVGGTPVVDGIIYFQLGSEYFRRNVNIINPYIFGVKADGVTNDTLALQAAIDFASTSDIKEIIFSPSENPYRFTHLDLIGAQYSGISLIGSKGVVFKQILGTRHMEEPYPYPTFARYNLADGFLLINDGINLPSNPSTFEETAVKDITIDGITFLNDVVNDEFDELMHQICAVGVSNFTVKNCEFIGFLGDGIAVTNRVEGGQNIRMNRNVNIIYNSFDGINRDNRQAVSVYGCDGFSVNYNKIKNTTRPNMPGAIDIEPDNVSTILRGGEIKGNKLYNIGGNIGAIAITLYNNNVDLNYPDTAPLQAKITVSKNVIVDCTFAAFTVISPFIYGTSEKYIKSVVFKDNYISNSGFGYIVNVSDVIIENNFYENVFFVGDQINAASYVIIRENTIRNMVGLQGFKIEASSNFITIKDNKFINPEQHCITDNTRGGIIDLTGNWFDNSDVSIVSYVVVADFNLTYVEVGNSKYNNNRVTGNLDGTMLTNIARMNNLGPITIAVLPKGFPYGESLNEYNDGLRNVILKTTRTEESTVLQELITSDAYETVFTRYAISENEWSEFKPVITNPITGLLTAGSIPVAVGTTSLANSIMHDYAEYVAIETDDYPYLKVSNLTDFLNVGITPTTSVLNSSRGFDFVTNDSTIALKIIDTEITLPYRPITRVGAFDILTRDIATGVVEKKESSFFQKALSGYTVATLPAGVLGDTAYVTDATSPTYLGTLVGGGAVKCPVFYNGTNWVSH